MLIGWVLLVAFQPWSRGTAPALEWRAGLWVAPWLIGIMVISVLGDYGGGLGVLSLGRGVLAVFGSSS
jgi:hypothetical protein